MHVGRTKIKVAELLDRFKGEELAVSALCVRIARTGPSSSVDLAFMLALAEEAINRASGGGSRADEGLLLTKLAEALRAAEANAAANAFGSAANDVLPRPE